MHAVLPPSISTLDYTAAPKYWHNMATVVTTPTKSGLEECLCSVWPQHWILNVCVCVYYTNRYPKVYRRVQQYPHPFWKAIAKRNRKLYCWGWKVVLCGLCICWQQINVQWTIWDSWSTTLGIKGPIPRYPMATPRKHTYAQTNIIIIVILWNRTAFIHTRSILVKTRLRSLQHHLPRCILASLQKRKGCISIVQWVKAKDPICHQISPMDDDDQFVGNAFYKGIKHFEVRTIGKSLVQWTIPFNIFFLVCVCVRVCVCVCVWCVCVVCVCGMCVFVCVLQLNACQH